MRGGGEGVGSRHSPVIGGVYLAGVEHPCHVVLCMFPKIVKNINVLKASYSKLSQFFRYSIFFSDLNNTRACQIERN